jgi:hypothetical protein
MNCQNTRAAIEIGHKDAYALRHLSGCAACRSYEGELNALSSLLKAQPRVQTPASFEARLQARLTQARADGSVKLSYLLQSAPRVEAPADFDFRLRARLARAQAEPHGLWARLAGFWQQSFSLGQAAAAMTVLAVAVTFTTSQLLDNRQTASGGDNLAVSSVPVNGTFPGQFSTERETVPVNAPRIAKVAARAGYRITKPVLTPALAPAAAAESSKLPPVKNEAALINLPSDGQAQYGYGQQIARLVAAKAETATPTF